jgi:hypothetical protein
LSTELLAGASSYHAAKEYEQYVNEHGHPDNAGPLISKFVDDWIDSIVKARGIEGVDIAEAKADGMFPQKGQYQRNLTHIQGARKAESRVKDDHKVLSWNSTDQKWPSSHE